MNYFYCLKYLPASTKCWSVGNRFFTFGETFDKTIVRQRHTYRIIIRRIKRPRSSCNGINIVNESVINCC